MDLNLFIMLLGTMTITSYRAVPMQTKPECTSRYHCETSIGENVSELGCAVSQDLLKSGKVHYRDVLYIEGHGYRIVNDTMALKNHNAVDLFVYTKAEEHKIGVQHRKVWLIHVNGEPQCSTNHTPNAKTHRAAGVAKVEETILSDTTVHSELR
jgi:3D (Asp-Asp-Asp) domain-containing protein